LGTGKAAGREPADVRDDVGYSTAGYGTGQDRASGAAGRDQERVSLAQLERLFTFLQSRAESGDKVALAVLRSQKERQAGKVSDKNPEPEKTFLIVPFTDKAAAKDAGAKWDRAEKKWYAPAGAELDQFAAWLPQSTSSEKSPEAILETTAPYSDKQESQKKESVKSVEEKTAPVTRLSWLAWQENERMKAGVTDKSRFTGFQLRIDNRGVVIISLASGGTIRDAGNKLHFSPDNERRQAVRLYAMAKFGQNFSEKDNSIKRKEHGRWKNLLKPHLGVLRICLQNYGYRLSKR